jgi:HNH endonuclease
MNSQTYWLFNTDETEEEGEGADLRMIDHSCIAAWGNCKGYGAEKTLQKPLSGDEVFLFCARKGIVGKGQLTDEPPFASDSIFPTGHDEYQRLMENLEVLPEPLAVADILKETGYSLPFRHIVCKLKNERAIKFIVNYFNNAIGIVAGDGEFSDKQLDEAIRSNRLRFRDDVLAYDMKVMARQRHGQDRLRALTLDVYGHQCALCDIADTALLEASHIVRWTDDPSARADLANIICLCRIHHALFECGYISLTDKFQVVKEPDCQGEMLASVLALTSTFRIKDGEYSPKPKYLRQHRQRCNL